MIYHYSAGDIPSLAHQFVSFSKAPKVNHIGRDGYSGGIPLPEEASLHSRDLRIYNIAYEYIGWLLTILKKHQEEQGASYKEIMARDMQDRYKGYQKVNKFLELIKVIEINPHYQATKDRQDMKFGYPMGYKLHKSFAKLTPTQQPVIESVVAREIQRIENTNFPNKDVLPKSEIDQSFYMLLKHGIKIEYFDWQMMTETKSSIISAKINLTKLKNGITQMKKDDYERVYHSIVYMPSFARNFIKLKDGRSFACLDVSASHLFQMILCYAPCTIGLEKMIANGLYETLAKSVGVDRDMMKTQYQKCMNGIGKPKEIMRALKLVLPPIYDYIEAFKPTNFCGYRDFSQAKACISYEMMKMESELITVHVASSCLRNNIPLYTVHDAIYVPADQRERALSLMQSVYKEQCGIIPKIKTTVLN
jgi:hypothetical protein